MSSRRIADLGVVDHMTSGSHWCALCWRWVLDCEHLVNPLPIAHLAVDDLWIKSLSYDRVHGRLEIDFTWHDVRQFYPVSPSLFRDLWRSRPMQEVLDRRIMKNRHISSAYVRSERRLMRVLLRCWEVIAR